MPPIADVVRCARAGWREKAAWSVVLVVCFCAPYFALQRWTLAPVRTLPPTPIDEAIAFDPAWVWPYQSGYLLMTLVPWLLDRRGDLRRFVADFLLVAVSGFVVFLVMPIAGPRPEVLPARGMYALLVAYDGPTNAFPSLHIGLLTATVLAAARASRGRLRPSARACGLSAAVAWTILVGYAALATKQHYAIDLPAGAALAWIVHRRPTRRASPVAALSMEE